MYSTKPSRPQPLIALLPTVLAILLSIGLHRLIWVVQPVLSLPDKPLWERRQPIKVIALTPMEISRLPEFIRLASTLPPLSRPAPAPTLTPTPTQPKVLPPQLAPAKSNVPLPPPPIKPRRSVSQTETNSPNSPSTATLSFKDALTKSRYGYEVVGTTEKEAKENLNAWLKQNKQSSRSVAMNSAIPNTIKSGFSEKLPDVNPARVVVLIDRNGKMVGEPKLIRSTGYPKLDQAAVEDVKRRSFTPMGQSVVYQYQIEIDQSNLPAAGKLTTNLKRDGLNQGQGRQGR